MLRSRAVQLRFVILYDSYKIEGFDELVTWFVFTPDKPVDKTEFISILIPSNSSEFPSKSNIDSERTHKKRFIVCNKLRKTTYETQFEIFNHLLVPEKLY